MLFIYHILTSDGGLVHCFVTASPKIYHSAINQYFYGNITVEHADIRTGKQTKIDPCNTDDKQKNTAAHADRQTKSRQKILSADFVIKFAKSDYSPFFAAKHSLQRTGLSSLGLKGTLASLPHSAQTAVKYSLWPRT